MVGQTILHYRVLGKVGQGAMGVVYKAEDTLLRRSVALKFLSPQAVSDEILRARFFREAQAAGALSHPSICQVYGIEEHDGKVFIVMAYLAGESLDRVLASCVLPVPEALDYALQIGDGLREAHENGIVHRDLKSANIIVTTKGRAVITDFGLAMLSNRSRITRSGTTLGTPIYMSPEQAVGKRVDHRADIWSLGVVIYEMLTGQFPFTGKTMLGVRRAILTDVPRPIAALRKDLPDDISWIMSKLLAKNPGERYQHVDDLLVDLRALRRKIPDEEIPRRPAPPSEPPPDFAARTLTLAGMGGTTIGASAGINASAGIDASAGGQQALSGSKEPPSGLAGQSRLPRTSMHSAWRLAAVIFAAVLLAGMALIWWKSLN